MIKNLSVHVWNHCHRNGFILLKVVLAVTLMALLLAAYVPALVQCVRVYDSCRVEEELFRQGSVLEEALFLELRYASCVVVRPNEVRFHSVSGYDTAYRVQGGILYRILENGSKQPMTGNSTKSVSQTNTLTVAPLENRPFFSEENGVVTVQMVLRDYHSQAMKPVLLCVRSVNDPAAL